MWSEGRQHLWGLASVNTDLTLQNDVLSIGIFSMPKQNRYNAYISKYYYYYYTINTHNTFNTLANIPLHLHSQDFIFD